MQAADNLMNDSPAKGRVDQTIFFLITYAGNGREWARDYVARNPQSRIPVVFLAHELVQGQDDPWLTRNIIREQLFSRDLFDYQLPLDNDLYFFGRDQIVADHVDAIRRSQNRGLFGLRKTGKTSILFRLKRLIERESVGAMFYYDCKIPSIRMLRWYELLAKITKDIGERFGVKAPRHSGDPRHAAEIFIKTLSDCPEGKIVTLVFDEIEYISPIAISDRHWQDDFVPFWQTLWSAQSEVRRLSNIIVGVNPSVVEVDVIGGVQNPMFGIISPKYLRGLDSDATRHMIRTIGKKMGLKFSVEACDYLYTRYGGHPLLTRMACSKIHEEVDDADQSRPVDISEADLEGRAASRDEELVFYCRHVVSELKRFYPDEYELLEMLASGQVVDVMDFTPEPEYTRHLRGYGLLKENENGRPEFAIPVIGKHIGNELARAEGRTIAKKTIPDDERVSWVRRRAESILKEMRELSRVLRKKGLEPLFEGGEIPESERVATLAPSANQDQFIAFINVCNRSFVESVEKCGRSRNKKKYFWEDVRTLYPELWDALQRIKVYRNNDLHLELNATVEGELDRYFRKDLEGRRIQQVADCWFLLQQVVLDELMLGIQCEINRYS